jgi:carbamoyl-phosphate synthase large subunit
MNQTPTILLSAAGGMPSKGVIDTLSDAGATIVTVDINPYSYGLMYVNDSYVVPRGDDSKFVDEMLAIVRKEDVDGLLISPESEALAVSLERERFESEGCLPLIPPHNIVQRCADKLEAHSYVADLNIPSPELYCTRDDADFPCVVKPRYGRGSAGVHIAYNQEELAVYASNIEDPIFQEYVSGTEYTVDVLTGRDGTVLSVVPRERIGIESGKSVTGKTVVNEKLRKFSHQIASDWKLFGPSCIQFIRDGEELHFLEVNTRFGGGAVLSMQADSQLVPNLFKMIQQVPTDPSDTYDAGLVMLRNYDQLFVDQSTLHE